MTTFRDLKLNERFTFHGEGFTTYRSFYATCWKISPRKYADGVHEYEVGTINVQVYPIAPKPAPTLTEDQIERNVERAFDRLDRQFMAEGSSMTQSQYNALARQIATDAEAQYAAMKAAN